MPTCWDKECDGDHDQYIHPWHTCAFPDRAHAIGRGVIFTCDDCTKVWRVTKNDFSLHGAVVCGCGWERIA